MRVFKGILGCLFWWPLAALAFAFRVLWWVVETWITVMFWIAAVAIGAFVGFIMLMRI